MEAEVRAHTFQPRDLVGGHLVLDFVNTVTARNAEPLDWLDGYPRLLEWASMSGAFPPDDLAALRQAATADARAAARALTQARQLRETVWEQLATGSSVQRLQDYWHAAAARTSLRAFDGHVATVVTVAGSGLDYVTHSLALQAVRFLEDVPRDRLRVCDGRQCGWFYLDTSKAGRRRWCDMATCGNAEKTRRHSARRP